MERLGTWEGRFSVMVGMKKQIVVWHGIGAQIV